MVLALLASEAPEVNLLVPAHAGDRCSPKDHLSPVGFTVFCYAVCARVCYVVCVCVCVRVHVFASRPCR